MKTLKGSVLRVAIWVVTLAAVVMMFVTLAQQILARLGEPPPPGF